MAYDIAEIAVDGGLVVCIVRDQPFVPVFPPSAPRVAVDVTGLDLAPEAGWAWLGGGFAPPPEGKDEEGEGAGEGGE
jgi:hypothetical protein